MDPEMPAPVLGEWGGEHLGLVAGLQGAELEFDCASGRTSSAITPDAAGRFSVDGFHFPGHGGPIREGEERVELAAHFETALERGDAVLLEHAQRALFRDTLRSDAQCGSEPATDDGSDRSAERAPRNHHGAAAGGCAEHPAQHD